MSAYKPAQLMPIAQKRSLIVNWFVENHKIDRWGAHQSHWVFANSSMEDSGMISCTLFRRAADDFEGNHQEGSGNVIITQDIRTAEITIGWYSLPRKDQRVPNETYSTLSWSSLSDEKIEIKVEASKPEGYGTWA